jgi:hypothetical protein
MNLKVNGAILLVGCLLGVFIGSKISLPGLPLSQPPAVNPPAKVEGRKIERKFDPTTGKLSSESVVENISTPSLMPKPRYKITLMPVWSPSGAYYGALYEKRYDLPVIRDVYIGAYLNSRLEVGLSLSKEFY